MSVSQPSGENIDKKCRDLSPVLLPDFEKGEKGDWLRPRCLSPFSEIVFCPRTTPTTENALPRPRATLVFGPNTRGRGSYLP